MIRIHVNCISLINRIPYLDLATVRCDICMETNGLFAFSYNLIFTFIQSFYTHPDDGPVGDETCLLSLDKKYVVVFVSCLPIN